MPTSSNFAFTLGISEEGDCRDELTIDEDPTSATTNLDQSSEVATVIDHWGGTAVLNRLESISGVDRVDNHDAPVSIVHGTADATVPFREAEVWRDAHESTGVAEEWNPLGTVGHGPGRVRVGDQTLVESAADFTVEIQRLQVR